MPSSYRDALDARLHRLDRRISRPGSYLRTIERLRWCTQPTTMRTFQP
jgi:hypothetical protein